VLEKVASEINTVVEASKKSPMFSQFIKDLSVPKETRVKAITEIFAEAGFLDVSKNFLGMLFYPLMFMHLSFCYSTYNHLSLTDLIKTKKSRGSYIL
jgi:F0F1-type ATP synthase delta subunit